MALNRYDPATAIPILEERIKALAGGAVSRKEIEEIIEATQQPMYRLDIYATTGNLLYEDNKTTTLVAEVTSWDIDVTSDFSADIFKWRRVSGDNEADAEWNAAHSVGSKTLLLTIEDVGSQSTFYCAVDDNEKIDVEASILVMSNTELERTIEWVKSLNPFVHIKYSMNANGVPFYDSPADMEEEPIYMGICYTGESEDPTEASEYTWLLFKGMNGDGVTDMKTQYYLSDSNSTCIGGTWTDEQVQWQVAKWIWIRNAITWDNGTTTYTTPVLAKALNQANISAQDARAGVTALEKGVTTAIGNVSSRIETEKGRVDALLVRADATDTTITSLQGDVQQSQTNISQLKETTTELTTDFGEIKERVETSESQISDINGEINSAKERISAAEQKITDDAIINTVKDVYATKVELDNKSVKVEYAISDSATVAPTSGWSTTAPTWQDGKYIWQKVTNTKADGTSTFSTACITGAKGATGVAGAKGDKGDKGDTGATGPQGPQGEKGATGEQGPQGETGAKGDKGDTGAAGKGVESYSITYQAGASQISPPTGTWLSTVPILTTALPYLWTRTIITYTDNTTSTAYSVSSTLESFEVGGRNLLKNSESIILNGTNYSSAVELSEGLITIIAESGAFNAYRYPETTVSVNELTAEAGEIYAFSGEIKMTGITSAASLVFDFRSEDEATKNRVSIPIPSDKDGEWQTVSGTLAVANTGLTKCVIIISGSQAVKDATIEYRHFKLERGNKATDWSPAPEDMVEQESFDTVLETINEQISSVDIKADGIESKVSEHEETVSGLLSKTEEIESKVNQTASSVDTRFKSLQEVVTEQGTLIKEQETLIRASGNGIEIGKTNSNVKMSLDEDSLDFNVNGEAVATYGVDGLWSKSVEAERQLTLNKEWAIRPGATIAGKGHNLNIQYIGG